MNGLEIGEAGVLVVCAVLWVYCKLRERREVGMAQRSHGGSYTPYPNLLAWIAYFSAICWRVTQYGIVSLAGVSVLVVALIVLVRRL